MIKKGSLFAWLICGLGALFYCYEYILRITPSIMTQELMQSFNISAAALGNLVGFYYYAYTPMQLPVGVMMDRYGPRRLLALAALICALGTLLFTSHSLHLAQGGRFLVGIGSSFAFVGVLKLATIWLPPNRFAFVAGAATALGMLGGVFGDILLTPVIYDIGWHNTFYYSAAAGLLLSLLIWLAIPANSNEQKTEQVMTYNKLLAQLFTLIKNPQMWLVGLLGLAMYLPVSVFAELWGVPYLILNYHLANTTAATMISSIFIGWAIGGPLLGWISDRLAKRRLPIIFCLFLAIIAISVILYVPALAKDHLYFWLMAFGIFTSAEVIVFPIAYELNLPGFAGTAIAMTNMLVMLGGVLFQPLIGVFLELLSNKHDHANLSDLSTFAGQNFQFVLGILPGSLIIGVVLIMFIKETNACSIYKRNSDI